MKRAIKILPVFLVYSFVTSGLINAEWVEREKPIMKGVGWNYPIAGGDFLIFDPGGGSGEAGTHVYNSKTDKVRLLDSGIYRGKSIFEDSLVLRSLDGFYLYNLSTGKKVIIKGGGGSIPSVYSDTIVYEDNGNLILYNIKTKKERRIKLPEGMYTSEKIGPIIHGDKVGWLGRSSSNKLSIMSYDLNKGKVSTLYKLTKEEADLISKSDPEIFRFDGDTVLLSNQDCLFIFKVKDGEFKMLSEPGKRLFQSSLGDGKVVWDSDGGEIIHLYDIAKGEFTELTSKGSQIYSVTISKNRIFFEDYNKYEMRMFEYK